MLLRMGRSFEILDRIVRCSADHTFITAVPLLGYIQPQIIPLPAPELTLALHKFLCAGISDIRETAAFSKPMLDAGYLMLIDSNANVMKSRNIRYISEA